MRYTTEDCLTAVETAAEILERSPSAREYYRLWERGELGPDAPSYGTVQNRCGSWNDAKAELGLDTRERWENTCEVDETYFKHIVDAERAYWFGLLYADGGIVASNNGPRLSCKLELTETDGHLVEQFAKAVSSTYAIRRRTQPNNNSRPSTTTAITNYRFCSMLVDRGITPNGKAPEPVVPDNDAKLAAFLRGFFDGDGTVRKGPTNYPAIVAKDAALGDWLNDAFHSLGVETSHFRVDGGDWEDKSVVQIANRPGVDAFCSALYPDGMDTSPCLARKRNPLLEQD